MEDYICRDDFCHLHLSILTNGVFPRRNVLSSNQKMGNGVRCKQTSLMLMNVCKAIFIRRSTARSKTTKKSHVNWVCAACLYHLSRLHHHLYRLQRSWNNSNMIIKRNLKNKYIISILAVWIRLCRTRALCLLPEIRTCEHTIWDCGGLISLYLGLTYMKYIHERKV